MILLRLVSPYIRERSSSILRVHRKKRKRKNVLIPKQQSQQRRHVTITRAKILRASGNVVIPRFPAIVSHSICQRGCIFSPLLFEARKSRGSCASSIRPFFFFFFFSTNKTRVVQREESYVPRRAYRFFPTCLETSVFVPIHLSIHFTWSIKQTVIGLFQIFFFFLFSVVVTQNLLC